MVPSKMFLVKGEAKKGYNFLQNKMLLFVVPVSFKFKHSRFLCALDQNRRPADGDLKRCGGSMSCSTGGYPSSIGCAV